MIFVVACLSLILSELLVGACGRLGCCCLNALMLLDIILKASVRAFGSIEVLELSWLVGEFLGGLGVVSFSHLYLRKF